MKTLRKIQIALLGIVCMIVGALPVNAQLHRTSKNEVTTTSATSPHQFSILQSTLIHYSPDGIEAMVLSDYGPLNINAGKDITICNSESHLLEGLNNTTEKAMWITDGDGVFDNPYSLHPVYTAGENDKMYGEVILNLCIITPGSIYPIKARDSMVLTLQNWCGSNGDEDED